MTTEQRRFLAHKIGRGGTQEVMRAGTMPDSPRLSIIGVVPVVILLLLASVTGGVGADEGDEVASSSWWHGPDPPEGEPTDLEREMFHQRTPSCIVCQRAVHYLDENLLVKILDERAKDRSVNDPANYGRIEAIVEDEVSKVCSAQGIQLDKNLRKKCDDMLERFEDVLVRAWYDRSVQDDDWNMNWRICAKKHGLLKVCPVEIARLDVPQLDHLEQEVKLEELRSPVTEDKDGRRRVRYQTQAGKKSLFNTPPSIAVYIMKLVLEWVKGQGGIEGVERINAEKVTEYDPPPLPEQVILPVPPEFRMARSAEEVPLDAERFRRAREAALKGLQWLAAAQGRQGGWMVEAEAVHAIRNELARTLTDIVHRRMMIGLDADQGRTVYERIAAAAATELNWSELDKAMQLDALRAYSDSLRVAG